MTKFTRFKMLLMALVMLVGSGNVWGQPWTYNFGTGTGTFSSSTASTSFLPAPPSGTARVRVGTNPGSIVLANPGLAGLGSDTELQITSNTGSSSTTKFSVYDYSAAKAGYIKFKIAFSGGTNGVYKFSLGDGANFSDNNAISAAQIFAGIEWTLGASNAISYKVLNATSYGTTGISSPTTLFVQSTSTVYQIEIYINNNTTSASYDRSGSSYSLTNATWDLWVDGIRVGTGLAKGGIGTDVNIDSYSFNHQNSVTTPGTIYIDDIEYSNALPISSTPTVVAPTFSLAAGTYYSTQNVSLSSITAGATIYYTTDGSDPDDTDTQYSTPIAVSTTTTIKAKAYKDGMDPSGIASATYTFPTINNVSNVAALRAGATDGTVYKLTGEALLTLQSTGAGKPKYIQDATGGILVYDSGAKIASTYNIGDGITNIIGTLTTSTGMLQFIPVADPGAATSTGNTLTPVEIDLANLANYPGQLVKVSGVTITGTGNFVASTNYNLNSSATTILRTQYSDLNYIGQPIPTVPQDIVGVVLMYNTTAQLVPRSLSDFSNTVFASPTIIVSEATVPAMTAQVGLTDAETITVNAQNLTENISLAVTGTDATLFTLSTNSIVPVSGTVTDQSVTITYTPTAAGSHTATLTLSSAGAESVVKTLSGSATWPPLDAPVATDASGIGQTSFTANWNAVSGATSYELSVYTKQESTVDATDLFISEYIEGSSSNKYIEIYNGTGSSIDLSDYKLELYPNGGVVNPSVVLSGTLANGAAKVYKNSAAALTLPEGVIAESNGAVNYNGDDAIALYKVSTASFVDIFGRIGNDPGTSWTADGGYSSLDKTLRRKSSVTGGITVSPTGTGATAFTTLGTEWDLYDMDNVADLGSHTFGSTTLTPISGSPFTVTGETSKAITGLSAGTNYYYTVVAKNVNVTSNSSNEITAPTFATSVNNPLSLGAITAFDGKIRFTATAGQQVEVYNAVGQKLMSATTLDGLNTLNVNAKGMMIVKVGDRLAKVIL